MASPLPSPMVTGTVPTDARQSRHERTRAKITLVAVVRGSPAIEWSVGPSVRPPTSQPPWPTPVPACRLFLANLLEECGVCGEVGVVDLPVEFADVFEFVDGLSRLPCARWIVAMSEGGGGPHASPCPKPGPGWLERP